MKLLSVKLSDSLFSKRVSMLTNANSCSFSLQGEDDGIRYEFEYFLDQKQYLVSGVLEELVLGMEANEVTVQFMQENAPSIEAQGDFLHELGAGLLTRAGSSLSLQKLFQYFQSKIPLKAVFSNNDFLLYFNDQSVQKLPWLFRFLLRFGLCFRIRPRKAGAVTLDILYFSRTSQNE
jgi:hypothetical protein